MGYFITFEGVEGCGKSTQAKLLAEHLKKKGYNVLLTREPGGPKISEQIRTILLNAENTEMLPETELLLYMASRSQHTGEWILPALSNDFIVISDRYYDSTIAYQGAARSIDMDVIKRITDYATYGLTPDITFLIDIPAELGLSRIAPDEADRLEKESIEFHKKVRNGFLLLSKLQSKRFFVINGQNSIKDISDIIKEEINKKIKEKL